MTTPTSISFSAMEASSASASGKEIKVLKAVKPRILCTRCGSEIGRENIHRKNTRRAGNREAHDSRMQGSAKSNGLWDDGQKNMTHQLLTDS